MKLEGWKGSWPTGSWDLEAAANLNSGRLQKTEVAAWRGGRTGMRFIGFLLFVAWESLSPLSFVSPYARCASWCLPCVPLNGLVRVAQTEHILV